MRKMVLKGFSVFLAAGILLVGLAGCGLGQEETSIVPSEKELTGMFDEDYYESFQADGEVPVEKGYITFAFRGADGKAEAVSPDEIQIMADEGRLDDIKKWSATFSGAAALKLGNAVTIWFSGDHEYAAVGWCEGVFLIVEGDSLPDLDGVFE